MRMQIDCLSLKETKPNRVSAVVLGIQENQKDLKSHRDLLPSGLLEKVERFISRSDFRVRKGDILNFDIEESSGIQKLYVTVLSKAPALEEVRQICGRFLDLINAQGFVIAQILVDSFSSAKFERAALVEAMSEVIHLSSYRFNKFKPHENSMKLKSIELLFRSPQGFASFRKSLQMSQVIAESVNFVRDLVNTPANELP